MSTSAPNLRLDEAPHAADLRFDVDGRGRERAELTDERRLRVISEATPPDKSYPPRSVTVLPVAALSGAAASRAFVILIGMLTGRPRHQPHDLRRGATS
jgi:hypothetical protein